MERGYVARVSDVTPPPPPTGYGYAQAAPYVLASKGKRLGAWLLDILLLIVTLIIGWVIWWIILWKQGQSPAKSILKMRVYKIDAGRAANTGEMAVRELVGKWLLGFIPFWLIINGIVIIVDEKSQGLWDKIGNTVVIEDPNNQFRPPGV